MNFIVGLLISSVDGYYKATQNQKKSKPQTSLNPQNSSLVTSNIKRERGGREISYEARIKGIIQKKYNRPFVKIRESWLQNPSTKRNLELDIYNKELKLAFEIQDSSHFIYIPFYHKNEETFRKLQQRDELKKRLCKQQGVKLICIDTRKIHPSYTDDEIWELILQEMEN